MRELQNISILNVMPPNLVTDKGVQIQAAAFDEALREIIAKIPSVCILPRIQELTDSLLLDLLAWQFHVDFYDSSMPAELKRVLVHRSLDWHTRKGTPSVVEEIVTEILGKAEVHEWNEYGGEPGYFRVKVEAQDAVTEKEMADVIAAIYSVKNTRSWLELLRIITEIPETTLYTGGAVVADTQRIEIKTKDIGDMSFETRLCCGSAWWDVGYVSIPTKTREGEIL